jgi:hypothetical protein
MNIDAQGSTFEEKTPKRQTCLKVEEFPEAAQRYSAGKFHTTGKGNDENQDVYETPLTPQIYVFF